MLPPHTPHPDGRLDPEISTDRLDEIIADYLDAQERGCAPAREELLAAHPDLAGELAEFLRDQDRVDAVVAPLVGRSGRAAGLNPAARQVSVLPAGQIVGGYVLLEELGRGGMGVVYKARQEGVNRYVALKMIGAGAWATPGDLQRFRLEAAAIAELDHPHIVPLYEIGEADGRPFYSMKWVEGGSLANQVERLKGRSRDGARLLLQVARAIEHAHQHGILHRDLKPANILLASGVREGEAPAEPQRRGSAGASPSRRPLAELVPFVTDFGLAKKLSMSEATNGICTTPAAPTLSGTALGTPSYMAPEQARNARAATTAADVYSLGAILYECLTGRPPFQSSNSLETLLDVLEREPLAPSKVYPGIDRDLDTICLKCLHKEPEKRYKSAAALADDLERYLNREPILARPVGRLERLARWCRRQPVVAALSAAVVVSIVVGMILVFSQWRRAQGLLERTEKALSEAETERERAEEERGRAEKERGEAQEQRKQAENQRAEALKQKELAEASVRQTLEVVDRFCIGLSEDRLSQYSGLQPLRKELLEAGLKHYQVFLKRNAGDPRLKEKVASTHRSIGLVNAGLGRRKEALSACQQSLECYQEILREKPDDIGKAHEVAKMLMHVAAQQHALGDTVGARNSFIEAREILEDLDRRKPKDPAIQSALVSLKNNEGALAGDTVRPREPPPNPKGEDVVTMRRRLVEQAPENAGNRFKLAIELHNRALARYDIGKPDDAMKDLQESRELLEELLRSDEKNHSYKYHLGETLRVIANKHGTRKQFTEANALHGRARELLEEIVQANPELADYQAMLANLLSDIGSSLGRQGKPASAFSEHRQALAMRKELFEKHPSVPEYELGLAQSYHNVGNMHSNAGRNGDALKSYREAEKHFRALVKRTPENLLYPCYLAGTLNNIGDLLQKLGQPEEGLTMMEEAVKSQRSAFDRATHSRGFRRDLAMYSRNLARAYRLARRPADSLNVSLEIRKLYPDEAAELVRLLPDFVRAARLVPKEDALNKRCLDHALETLAMAIASGYRDYDSLRKDPDLKLLREREEFERLLK